MCNKSSSFLMHLAVFSVVSDVTKLAIPRVSQMRYSPSYDAKQQQLM